MHRRRDLRIPALVLPLLLALPAVAQEPPTPAPEPTDPAAAEPVGAAATEERPASGYWRGRHRVGFVVGQHLGETVRDAGILAAPVTGQPGSRDYPATSKLTVDLEDSPIFGVRYAWFGSPKWGIELGLSQIASEIVDPNSNLAEDRRILADETALTDPEVDALMARLTAHQAAHDIDVTFLDAGALHVFNPKKRWPIEVGGGIGWAFTSLTGPVARERLVTSDLVIDPGSGLPANREVANELADPAVPYGQCLADNDPCIEIRGRSALTWHAYLDMGYAFTPNLQLRLGARVRQAQALVDPGDPAMLKEVTLGLSFQFGAR